MKSENFPRDVPTGLLVAAKSANSQPCLFNRETLCLTLFESALKNKEHMSSNIRPKTGFRGRCISPLYDSAKCATSYFT